MRFAAASHEKAAAAAKEGRLAEEIVPVQVPQRKGDPLLVDTDEGVRPGTTAESLGALKPAFTKNGTITAGNASQISDGGRGRRRDVGRAGQGARHHAPRPASSATAWSPGPDNSLLTQPSRAIMKAAGKAGVDLGAVDLFEINEAFAAVGLASVDDLGIDEDKVNVNGGAIALGHPVGMSGTRVALTALLELRRRGASTAAVALCGGGGQGDAAILRALCASGRPLTSPTGTHDRRRCRRAPQ